MFASSALQGVSAVSSSGRRSTAGAKASGALSGGAVSRLGAQRKMKEPSLSAPFPARSGSLELRMVKQPEEQHRARYLTEGSRGTVKDQSQLGHPVVQVRAVCGCVSAVCVFVCAVSVYFCATCVYLCATCVFLCVCGMCVSLCVPHVCIFVCAARGVVLTSS